MIPVLSRYGPNVRLVNILTNTILPIEATGNSKLEGGGVYITQTFDESYKNDSRRPSRRKSDMMSWLSGKFGSASSSIDSSLNDKTAHSRKGSVQPEATLQNRRSSVRKNDSMSNSEHLLKRNDTTESNQRLKLKEDDGKASRRNSEDVANLRRGSTFKKTAEKIEVSIEEVNSRRGSEAGEAPSPTTLDSKARRESNVRKSKLGPAVAHTETNLIKTEEIAASAPDLRSPSPSTTTPARKSAKIEDFDDDDDKVHPTGNLSLIDFLNSDPSNLANPAKTAATARKKFTSAALQLLTTIPKNVYITIDNSVLTVNNSADNDGDRIIEKVVLGSVIAMLSVNGDTFEIIQESGTLKFKATTVDLMMKLICEINTANSLAALNKNLTTFDKPLAPECTVEAYRAELKSLFQLLDITSLEDVIEINVSELDSSDNAGGSVLVPTQFLKGVSEKNIGCIANVEKIASMEEMHKYMVFQSSEDVNKLDRDDKKKNGAGGSEPEITGVLMKHLSNSHLGMVVRYEVNSDGVMGKHSITAATIDKLIERLADEHKPDELYISTFLHTFRHFSSADIVLEKLMGRLNVLPSANATAEEKEYVANWQNIVRLRLADF